MAQMPIRTVHIMSQKESARTYNGSMVRCTLAKVSPVLDLNRESS